MLLSDDWVAIRDNDGVSRRIHGVGFCSVGWLQWSIGIKDGEVMKSSIEYA
jgi:hypothetical protein